MGHAEEAVLLAPAQAALRWARWRRSRAPCEPSQLPAGAPPTTSTPLRPPTVWDDAVCYFKDQQLVRVGRPYGRVCRRRLRAHLLGRCAAAGVRFLEAEVESASSSADAQSAELRLADGRAVRCRLPVLASGVAAGKLLRYEDGVPPVAAQTAYGIEVRLGRGVGGCCCLLLGRAWELLCLPRCLLATARCVQPNLPSPAAKPHTHVNRIPVTAGGGGGVCCQLPA